MVAMNLVYSTTAYPFGALSNRMSHQNSGTPYLVLLAADLLLQHAL
jgi:hypothetical protein